MKAYLRTAASSQEVILSDDSTPEIGLEEVLIKVKAKEHPFEQALEALGKTETRHARGKLVVSGCS